jgi:hypothetical protein
MFPDVRLLFKPFIVGNMRFSKSLSHLLKIGPALNPCSPQSQHGNPSIYLCFLVHPHHRSDILISLDLASAPDDRLLRFLFSLTYLLEECLRFPASEKNSQMWKVCSLYSVVRLTFCYSIEILFPSHIVSPICQLTIITRRDSSL